MKRTARSLLGVLVLSAPHLSAQITASGDIGKQRPGLNTCGQINPNDTILVPAADRPTIAAVEHVLISGPPGVIVSNVPVEPHQVTFCSGLDLYYFGGVNHARKAAACLLGQLGQVRDAASQAQIEAVQSKATGGATFPRPRDADGLVLAMIYANGEGVPRNLPLAERFVCAYSAGIGSPTDDEQLSQFRKEMQAGGRYDVCFGGNYFGRSAEFDCLDVQAHRLDLEADRLKRAITATLPVAQQASFKALSKAFDTFRQARLDESGLECADGTGCGVSGEQFDVDQATAWVGLLKKVREGVPPAQGSSAGAYIADDRQLNAAYQAGIEQVKSVRGDQAAPIVSAMRSEERAWIIYRDRWVAFGRLRWPAIPAARWLAWLTEDRWNPASD